MKHFRRSTKSGDRTSDFRPGHTSIPVKHDYAIAPPKKVIKALYDYQSSDGDPNYLNFNTGDFLHVVGREDDSDWYEACNPVVGTRGLVPVNYFELVGKRARGSGGADSAVSSATQSLGGMTLVDRSVAASRQSVQNQHPATNGHNSMTGMTGMNGVVVERMSKGGRTSGAMVYGVVQYDFHAERPDELEAKAGEAIIVIAQSNPEWFVAKPITRLGGPGLIPVSFIEIRDMSTGTAVADPHEAVRKAGVPKVEEWKRMAASYKNSSIPLGKIGSSTENSQRVSVDSQMNGQMASQMNGQSSYQPYGSNGYDTSRQSSQSYSSLASPMRARVPRYCHHEMKFWFIVEAFMDNGKSWELNREYTDFYALQTALMDAFPQEAGKVEGYRRTLPFMPGPLPWVTERLTSERRDHMDRYLTSLLALPSHIISHPVVKQFFAPRENDTEIEGVPEDAEIARMSRGSSQHSYAHHDSRQSSTGNLSYPGTSYTSPSKSLQNPYQGQSPTAGYLPPKQGPSHQRGPSGANGHPMYSMSSGGSGSLAQIASASSASKPQVKVKAYFDGNDVVVLRLDEDFDYAKLVEKIRDRWPNSRPDNFIIDYKNEADGQFYPLSNESGYTEDQHLSSARQENEKLVLRVTNGDAY
ncbi:MAG: hypothetical protein Q9162_004858 [Coniocarpon cinnabarinum]